MRLASISNFTLPLGACDTGHPSSAAFPITYYLRVLRGILLKGAGIDAMWRDTLALVAFAVVLIAFSVRRFQKTIE